MSLTTLSHHEDGHLTQVCPEHPVPVIGSGMGLEAKPKTRVFLGTFFSGVVRKKTIFLPVGIASYKDDVSLELSYT